MVALSSLKFIGGDRGVRLDRFGTMMVSTFALSIRAYEIGLLLVLVTTAFHNWSNAAHCFLEAEAATASTPEKAEKAKNAKNAKNATKAKNAKKAKKTKIRRPQKGKK